ncbi:carbon starvation protein A, partial [Streptomyces sp. S9]|nr:carbon starvation protein A [Streptomyces sp. S9]
TFAGLIKIFDSNPAVGFLAQARKYSDAIARGEVTAPAKSIEQMHQIMINSYVNTGLTAQFLFVVFSVLVYSLGAIM